MSYVRDFVRAHQPTGKYRDMDKIEINTKESIANVTSIPTKENIKNTIKIIYIHLCKVLMKAL